MFRMRNPSGVMPTTFVLAFSVSHRVESFLLMTGAVSAAEGHCPSNRLAVLGLQGGNCGSLSLPTGNETGLPLRLRR